MKFVCPELKRIEALTHADIIIIIIADTARAHRQVHENSDGMPMQRGGKCRHSSSAAGRGELGASDYLLYS